MDDGIVHDIGRYLKNDIRKEHGRCPCSEFFIVQV